MPFSTNKFACFENYWSASFWPLILLLSLLLPSSPDLSLSSLPPSLVLPRSFPALSFRLSSPDPPFLSSLPPSSVTLTPSLVSFLPSYLPSFLSSFLPSKFFLFLIVPFFINITQGMAAIMPAMVIVGLAKTIHTLYMGLTLFSFGKTCIFDDT